MKPKIITAIVISVILFCFDAPQAQQVIFLVRHGETVAPKGTDSRPLSEAGQRRALLLAKLLKDAGINAIYTSELERTIKTAEPLAESLRIEPKVLSQLSVTFKPDDIENLVNRLRTEHRQDVVLVVGHPIVFPHC